MKTLADLLRFPDSVLDEEAKALWLKYQLNLRPRVYLAMVVVGFLAVGRNLVLGLPVSFGIDAMLVISAFALLLSGLSPHYFLRIDKALVGFILPLLVWQHFLWDPTKPSPTLFFFPMLVVVLASADHIWYASLGCVTGLVLALKSAFDLPELDQPMLKLLVALITTTLLLWVLSVVVWLREIGLCRRRAAVLGSVRESIAIRDELLHVFLQQLGEPLAALLQWLRRPLIDWDSLSQQADRLQTTLAEARVRTLELERKLFVPGNGALDEEESISRGIVRALLNGAPVATVLILVTYLMAHDAVRWSLLGSIAFSLALYIFAPAIAANVLRRRIAIWGLFTFVVWGCVNELRDSAPMFDAIYALILVYCAFHALAVVDAALMAVAAYALLAGWYWYGASVTTSVALMRGNFVLVLTFVIAFSIIRQLRFRQFLAEIGGHEQRLQIERDLRHRLMATLFHDVANPLNVIIGHIFMRDKETEPGTAVALMLRMGQRIRSLLDVTEALGAAEGLSPELPCETLSMAEVLRELQDTFVDKLKAKQLRLDVAPGNAPVWGNGTVLVMSVLSNLLTNAIKFSPSHGIITITTTLGTGERVGLLGIHITDQGAGIPQTVIDQVRRDQAVTSTHGTAGEAGHGQGLRLASMYLDKMQGALEFGAGSTVTAYVKLAPQQ
ncbi:MAG TPA: HAMP domain-containing sensor histidine kinase [Candidatus Acidoferrum sp.]|nr:HAMP domain-containing sensor histidine kinase [Candidatus Acidoferrum sp.]